MPRLMRDFYCEDCGNAEERFVDVSTESYPCKCSGEMVRRVGMPTVKLEGISGAFPGAHEKWAKIREDNARIKARRSE